MNAYLLIDHGSRRAEANLLIGEVAQRVRERLGEGAVVEGAHMELADPSIADAFARCVEQGATRVVAHPFMLTKGRHVSEDIPRLVAEAAKAHEGVDFVIAAPLGSHAGIIEAVVARCDEALAGDES
jgi:sirohydrochlorin ferrochelatase